MAFEVKTVSFSSQVRSVMSSFPSELQITLSYKVSSHIKDLSRPLPIGIVESVFGFLSAKVLKDCLDMFLECLVFFSKFSFLN